MKKAAAIILSLALVFILCSCGKEAEAPVTTSPDTTQTTQAPETTTPAPTTTETPATTPAQEEPAVSPEEKAEECNAIYKDFLCGKQKLKIESDYACFSAGESYLLDDFCQAFAGYQSEQMYEVDVRKVYYSYMDCGSDGIPELAIELEMGDEEDYESIYHYFVINCPEDSPVLVDGFEHYYRNYSSLNEAGIVECGGSSGAASHYYDYTWINGDCEETFLYSSSIEMANPKPAIPSYFLPKEIPSDYYDMWGDYDTEEYFTVHAYNFKEFDVDYDASDYDELYDIYCRDYFFTITNEEGDDVEPAEEYATLYKENNINIVSQDEAGKMISDRMEELGVSEDTLYAPYLSYSILDVEKVNDEVIVNDDGSITVGCTANFVDNIKDGATIYLKPGVYNLSSWIHAYTSVYAYTLYPCRIYPYADSYSKHIYTTGDQFIVNRVNDLTIASLDPEDPAEIVIDDEFSFVMIFCECSDLTINDIVAGHTPGNEGHCSADVFEFNECDRVTLNDCDLYGCGCFGIMAKQTAGLDVNGGRIHDCTSGMAELYGTTQAVFTGTVFENCDNIWGSKFYLIESNADFYECTFRNLSGDMFSLDSSSAWMSGCTMDDDIRESIESSEKYGESLYMY